jgi:hypothetical protein
VHSDRQRVHGDDRKVGSCKELTNLLDRPGAAIRDGEDAEIRFARRDGIDHFAEGGLWHRLVLRKEAKAGFVAERPRLPLIGDPHAIRAPIERISRVKSGKLVAIIAAESTSTG